MTGAAALNLLMARLGGRTNATLRANALLEMNLIQATTLEGGAFLPWFLIAESSSAMLTVAERRVELPTDFLRELDEDGLMQIQDTDGDWVDMTKDSYDTLNDKWGDDATSSLPTDYALVGQYLMIFPLPTVASLIRMRYYARGATIADDTVETVWLQYAPDLIIAETGIILASKHVREDPTKVMEFQNDRNVAYSRLVASNAGRAEANRNRRMG